MNKFITFTLGSIVAAAGIGAVALSVPGVEPTVSVQAEYPSNMYPSDVTDISGKWLPATEAIEVTFTLPTSCNYYGNAGMELFEFDSVDKVEVFHYVTGDYTGEMVYTAENVATGEPLTFTDSNVIKGKSYAYSVKYYLGTTSNSGYSKSKSVDAGLMPSQVTDITYTTTKGGYPVTITATTPTVYSDGVTEINEPVYVRAYSQSFDYTTYQTVTTELGKTEGHEAGSVCDLVITEGLGESGISSIYLVAGTADGESSPSYVSILTGEDYPGKPADFTVKENLDGSVTLSWEAPESARGGYFDPTATRYNVYVDYNNSYNDELIAGELEETTYTYTPELDKPTQVKFSIEAYNHVQVNSIHAEETLILGPAASLPFNETFDVVNEGSYSVTYSPLNLWTNSTTAIGYPKSWNYGASSYANGSQIATPDGTGGMAMVYYSQYDNSAYIDYLTSAKINVDGEASLEFSFNYYTIPGFTNIIAGEISFDGGEYQEVCRGSFNDATEAGWTTASGSVEVPAGATFANIRLASHTGEGEVINPAYLNIDNIKLRSADALAVVYPASVDNFNVEYDADVNSIIVSMTAPTKTHATLGDVNDADLDYITRIVIFRQAGSAGTYEEVHTFEHPAVGEELSWEDTELGEGGYFYYKAITYVEDRCDYGAFVDQPVLVGQIPAEVTDLTGVTTKGGAPIVLKWTAPTTDNQDKELKAIKSVTLKRNDNSDNATIKVWDDVKPGDAMEYTDNDVVKDVTYTYTVICAGTAGNNYGTPCTVSTKDDAPSTPQNIKAAYNQDGNVVVTWDPVTNGQTNGYVDLSKLTYSIYRAVGEGVYNVYDSELLAEGLTTNSYTDTNFDFPENSIKYFVKAFCGNEESYADNSNSILAGNPLSMPIEEHFSNGTGYLISPDIAWVSESTAATSNISNWSFSSTGYDGTNSIGPAGGSDDRGVAYCYYGIYSTEEFDDLLTSAHIKLDGGETPVVSFQYYGVPNFDSGLALAVNFDNGEFETIWSISFREVTETGWEKVYQPIDVPEGAKLMQVRFISHKGVRSCPVNIDEISIFDLPAPVLDSDELTRDLLWSVEESEYVDLAGFHVYLDGNRHNEKMLEPTASTHPSHPDVVADYTVTALYDKGQLESAHSNKLRVKGINGVASAEVAGVTIRTQAGNIIVEGAEGLFVTITNTTGATVYAAEGNCKVALTPATYIVKVGEAPAVKIFVR